ncbi:MAG: glycosyltransferase [Microscillaceae bacterium]|jgi:cellulose synthase/poly-beta-1,6-N-acetylglucosamine synthase-like glycosyltransferase|nr:glycosyltransferase [Microscillaceae bacterium]
MNLPTVAILVPFRNEEACLADCLQALSALDYPPGLWEVWLGDDDSEDKSAEIAARFCQNQPNFHLVRFKKDESIKANGKAQVLSQLIPHTQAEILAFTDADTEVSPQWLRSQLAHYEANIGIIGGWTLPKGNDWWAHLQTLEWLRAWQLMQTLSTLKIPLAVMGNNLIISRLAYDKVGGFAGLPFSATEDLAIFQAILQQGFSFQIITQVGNLACTQAIADWQTLVAQRRRWIRGVRQHMAWYWQILLLGQAAWLPLLLLGGVWQPWLFFIIFFVGFMIDNILIINGLAKTNQTRLSGYLLPFFVYQTIMGIVSLRLYFSPKPVQWKGRKLADG